MSSFATYRASVEMALVSHFGRLGVSYWNARDAALSTVTKTHASQVRACFRKGVPARECAQLIETALAARRRDPAHKRARHVLRARRRDPRTATVPEAILFTKSRYSTAQANAWLASHGYRKIKPIHTTANYHRARLRPPSSVRGMRTITFGKGIKAIIGHPKR